MMPSREVKAFCLAALLDAFSVEYVPAPFLGVSRR